MVSFGKDSSDLLHGTISGQIFRQSLSAVSASPDGPIQHHVEEILQSPFHGNFPVRWNADQRILVASGPSMVRLYRFDTNHQLTTRVGQSHPLFFDFNLTRDADVVISRRNGAIEVWGRDAQSYTKIRSHGDSDDQPTLICADLSPDDKWIIRGTFDGCYELFAYPSLDHVSTLVERQGRDRGFDGQETAFAPDSSRLAVGKRNGEILLWKLPELEALPPLVGHQKAIMGLEFSPDGQWLASGGIDGEIRVLNLQTGDVSVLPKKHEALVSGLSFSPDMKDLLSCGRGGTMYVWDLAKGDVRMELEGHHIWVNVVRHSPDGKLILTGADDNTARLWDAKDRQALSDLSLYGSGIRRRIFPRWPLPMDG